MMTFLRIVFCTALIAGSSVTSTAQQIKYRPDTLWRAYDNSNKEKSLAFAGGFNNPQFGIGDLNNDGKQDLVIFEKGSVQIKTFLNFGTPGNPDYRYRPRYERNFPVRNGTRAVGSYMKMLDLNCDNVPDIVTRGTAGFSIYYGYYNNNELFFNYYKDLYYSPLTATPEGFESVTFPTNGWSVVNNNNLGWSRVTSGVSPAVTPRTGSGMAQFRANAMSAGSTALLISRNFRLSPNLKSEGKVSFWIYRDNASAAESNAVYLGGIARSRHINLPDTKPADGWYEYTFPIPFHVVGNTFHFIFQGTSRSGNNIYIDDIQFVTSNIFGDVNAYVDPGGDIPGIADVDNDGDYDFFSFYIGGGFISYYKNYQVEEGLPCDTIHINMKDGCWGKIYQGVTTVQTLGMSCNAFQPPVPPAKVTHTGNTMCMFDYDGDGDIDYLNGGVSFNSIQLLTHGRVEYGHPRDTVIAQDTTWQTSGFMYNSQQFPAAFYVDIDQDGKNDILISPSAELASENYRNIAYYKNTGTSTLPVFTYQHDTLLVEDVIDLGAGSFPMLYDYDKDGRLDLFVGGDGYFQSDGRLKARIAYYRNTTNGSARSFTLQTGDFLNIDALNMAGAYPAVGDLDNDGLDDLVVGHDNGTISFYRNMASSASVQPQWQLTELVLKDAAQNDIDSFRNAAPFIYDIDQDGKPDLLIGGQNGWIALYRNIGGNGQLALQHQTSRLGGVRADAWNFLQGYSAPYIGKIDNSGTEYLMIGSNSGRIMQYTGFQNGNITQPYQVVDSVFHDLNRILGEYSGFRSVPRFGDLDRDGTYEMVLGNILGGVTMFTQQDVTSASDISRNTGSVKIHPNPSRDQVNIQWEQTFAGGNEVTVSLSNISGQRVMVQKFASAEFNAKLDISTLSPGMYFCEVVSATQRLVSKLVIVR